MGNKSQTAQPTREEVKKAFTNLFGDDKSSIVSAKMYNEGSFYPTRIVDLQKWPHMRVFGSQLSLITSEHPLYFQIIMLQEVLAKHHYKLTPSQMKELENMKLYASEINHTEMKKTMESLAE